MSSKATIDKVNRKVTQGRQTVLGFGAAILAVVLAILVIAAICLYNIGKATPDEACMDTNPCTNDVRTVLGCEHFYSGFDTVCEDVCLKDSAGTCAYADEPFCNGTCVGACPSDNATIDCPILEYNDTGSYMAPLPANPYCLHGNCIYLGFVGLDLQMALATALMGYPYSYDVNDTAVTITDMETAKDICWSILQPWEVRRSCLNVEPILLFFFDEDTPISVCVFYYECAQLVSEVFLPTTAPMMQAKPHVARIHDLKSLINANLDLVPHTFLKH